MRCLVVLACVCAVAYARAQSSEGSSAVITNAEIPVEESLNDVNSSSSPTQESAVDDVSAENNENASNDNNNEEDLDVAPTNLVPSVINPKANSERQGRYQALPDQYNQESVPQAVNKQRCIEKNERYSIPGSCDRYIECLNGTAEEKLCPDGLRYNPNVKFNVYPCQYPSDVPCLGRSALQPAQPTADCPHQFGYFKTGDSRDCGGFKNCVNGVGYEFNCPDGLAFSSETYRCEWPDQVAECDAEAFLGFRCPEVPVSKELGPPDGFKFYRSPSDCQVYFICIDGKPRRLGCGGYSAFDDLTQSCINAEEISACPQELRTRAAQAKEKEERRQRLLAETPFEKLRVAPEKFPTSQPTDSEPEQNLDDNVTPTHG